MSRSAQPAEMLKRKAMRWSGLTKPVSCLSTSAATVDAGSAWSTVSTIAVASTAVTTMARSSRLPVPADSPSQLSTATAQASPMMASRKYTKHQARMADARAGGRGGEAAAGVGDGELERAIGLLRADADGAAFGKRRNAVLDRVLDERREHHRRHARLQQRRWRLDLG